MGNRRLNITSIKAQTCSRSLNDGNSLRWDEVELCVQGLHFRMTVHCDAEIERVRRMSEEAGVEFQDFRIPPDDAARRGEEES